MQRNRFISTLLLTGALVTLLPATAQQAADPAQLQEALNRAQGLLRQLSQQRTQLEADLIKRQTELVKTEKSLAREKRDREELEIELELANRNQRSTSGKLERTEARLAKVEARLQEVVDKYKELAALHRSTVQEKDSLEINLADTQANLDDARVRNEDLFQANSELIDRLTSKGRWDDLLQREPLTGIKHVEMENVAQEYRFRNEDQRLAEDP